MKLIVFLLASSLSLVCEVSSLKCYTCIGVADPQCGEFKNSSSIKNETCPDGQLCFKVVATKLGPAGIYRGCQSDPTYAQCQIIETANQGSCLTCDTDLCNSSTAPYVSFITLIFGVLLKYCNLINIIH